MFSALPRHLQELAARQGGVLARRQLRAGAHPAEQVHRDLERDTLHALHESALTLPFGWHAVVADPCRVAAQVAAGLRRGGWTGRVGTCGPGCSVAGRIPA